MKSVLERGPIAAHVRWHPGRLAELDELAVVHETGFHNRSKACRRGGGRFTKTTSSSRVVAALLAAAGTCLEAADAVLEGRSRISYALVRPPGHHAQPAQADGFCFLAHETLVAERARARDRPRRRCRLGRPPRQRHAGVLLSPGGCAHDLAAHGARLLGASHTLSSATPWARGGVTARASTSTSSSTSAPATPPTPTRSRSSCRVSGSSGRGSSWAPADRTQARFDPNGRQNVSMAGFRRIGQLVGELAEELCEGRLVLVQEEAATGARTRATACTRRSRACSASPSRCSPTCSPTCRTTRAAGARGSRRRGPRSPFWPL